MGLGPIFNANSLLLTQNSGTLPTPEGYLDLFQPMEFTQVTKSVVGFQNSEAATNIQFYGLWQPASAQSLRMMKEGQRKWSYYKLHATLACQLQPDDVITYLGVQYRVLERLDYSLYGFLEYTLNNDYSGSGPAT